MPTLRKGHAEYHTIETRKTTQILGSNEHNLAPFAIFHAKDKSDVAKCGHIMVENRHIFVLAIRRGALGLFQQVFRELRSGLLRQSFCIP